MDDNKVLIIGIDGMEPILIEKWIEELPNLSTIIRNGAYGRLKSSIPPVSSPAWNWFAAGCQGGKTNIFDFIQPSRNYKAIPTVQSMSKKRAFWHLMSNEISIGICNLPLTYPIEPINKGFVVPGFPTPLDSKKDIFTYPAELSEEIRKISENKYIIDIGDVVGHTLIGDRQYYEKIIKIMRLRTNVFIYLLKKYKPDLAIMVYTSIDRASHRFFDKQELKDIYIEQDRELGNLLLDVSDRYPNIFLLSDHGFREVEGVFYINEWLKSERFLVKKKFHSAFGNSYSTLIRLVPDTFKQIAINFLPRKIKLKIPRTYSLSLEEIVDWKKTKAFGFGTSVCVEIYINDERFDHGNIRESEKEQIINEIILKITKLKHPLTGKCIIDKIYRQTELYDGQFTKNGPDITISLRKKIIVDTNFNNKKGFFEMKAPRKRAGDHSQYGFFGATGSAVKKGLKISEGSILDIAPTILHILNVPIPNDMEGRVLKEIYREDSTLYNREINYEMAEKKRILTKIKKLKSVEKL